MGLGGNDKKIKQQFAIVSCNFNNTYDKLTANHTCK